MLFVLLKLASQWFDTRRFGLVIALMGIMGMLGGIASQLFLEIALEWYGYHVVLLLDISLGFIIWCLIALFVWEPNKSLKNLNQKFALFQLKRVIVNPINLFASILAALLALPIFILTALWGKAYLMQSHHLNAQSAAFITSLIFIW